ncbi:hypothetical protein GCM10010503_30190 [Streptomyces lucensis JCM 4490]|uniref:SCO1431 family membrane protein n=1 Tax=Streptomyces lucensis JCM 4490 TaxID=1306176 RepID=A0A918J6E1_9ACTN|nr:hypothetical protein GCM10010503_30190 [Streptomyces lucensis JCM 4490]
MSNLSAARADAGGKVDERGDSTSYVRPLRETMSAHPATATRVRTGGPQEDGPEILEHVMGWVLVAVIAMFVTRLGLL